MPEGLNHSEENFDAAASQAEVEAQLHSDNDADSQVELTPEDIMGDGDTSVESKWEGSGVAGKDQSAADELAEVRARKAAEAEAARQARLEDLKDNADDSGVHRAA